MKRKSRFHYYVSDCNSRREISQEEFTKLLGEEYCYHTDTFCGIGISYPNYEKAEKLVASLKRGKANASIFSCGHLTLTFRKDPKPSAGRRSRDSRYPD